MLSFQLHVHFALPQAHRLPVLTQTDPQEYRKKPQYVSRKNNNTFFLHFTKEVKNQK